ncbi:glycosyltransferase family 39 protein [Patescibacteria group bacterium]|nr:glycosyltransferase family 39 protein [Patescibacteria group bacterium]
MNKKKVSVLVLISVAIYLGWTLLLLTKDPVVFPDETSFASIAWSLIDKARFSTTAYSSQLPQIQLEDFVYHGPIYYILLAGVFKVFGFGLISTRVSSVILGLFVIGLAYWLSRLLKISLKWAWLPGILLAVDYNFLRIARFGRPEVLVMLLAGLSLGWYIKLNQSPSRKNYIILGGLLVLGVLTHLALGWLVVVAIGVDVLVTKNWKVLKLNKIIWPALLAVIGLGGWFWYSKVLIKDLNQVSLAVETRFLPSFRSIQAILAGDLVIKIIFGLYGLVLMMLMLVRNKNRGEKLWSIVSLIMVIGVFWGGVDWYLGLLSMMVYVGLGLLINRFIKKNDSWYNLVLLLSCVVFFLNLLEQLRIDRFYYQYDYAGYSQEIAKHLRSGAKVWMKPLIPDPMFYLMENRPDLKLAYEEYFDHNQARMKRYLEQADYVIVYGFDYQAMELTKEVDEKKAETLMKQVNMNKILEEKLKSNQNEVILIEGNEYYSSLAIYDFNHSILKP